MNSSSHITRIPIRQIIGIVLLIILCIALVPQYGYLKHSLRILPQAHKPQLIPALLLTVGTYVLATIMYKLLAFKRLQFVKTIIVQLAAMFINRLIPSGFGALGVNFAYLKKEGHTNSEAATVVSLNNIMGLMGHMLLLVAILLLFRDSLPPFKYPDIGLHRLYPVLFATAAVVVIVLVFSKANTKLRAVIRSFKSSLLSYRTRPLVVGLAQLNSMALTLCNVGIVYFCLGAIGGSLSFAAVFIAFSFGVGTAAAVPTPGGIGGAEAGTAAGLVAYGVPIQVAIAGAVLYRIASFWLPLLVGLAAFLYCQRKHYLG